MTSSRRLLPVFVLVLLLAGSFAHADGTVLWGSSSPLIRGTRALAAEQYRRGAELLEEALRGPLPSRERAIALANLCAAYAGLGFQQMALSRCKEAIDADSRNWRSYSNRGLVLLARGRLGDAIDDFREALRLNPAAAPALVGLERALVARSETPPPVEREV